MSFRKSLSWLGLAQIIGLVLQFTTSVVFARYLTPHQMGVYAIAVALVGLLSVVQQLSLPAIIIREEVITEDFTRTAFTVNAAITIVFSAMIVLIGLFGFAASSDPGVRKVLYILALAPLFGIFSFLPMAQIEREGRFKRLALIGTVATIANAVVGLTLVIAGVGYFSIAYAQLAYSAVFTGLALHAGRAHVRFRFGMRSWRRVLGFSMQTMAISGIHTAGGRIIELMLGRIVGLSALGIYNRASGLNNLISQNISYIVARVVLVEFSELHRRGASLRERYIRTVAIMTATLWPAFAGLAVIAKPFIFWVYGAKWAAAVVPLAFMAISSILLASVTMTWEVFTAKGRMRDQTRVEVIRVVISTALFAAGCFWGLEAAAATRVIDAGLAILIYRRYLGEMTETSVRDFRTIYLQGAAVTVLAIAPAAALLLTEGATLPSVLMLCGAVLLGVALWAGGLLLFGHPLAEELKRFTAGLKPRETQPVSGR